MTEVTDAVAALEDARMARSRLADRARCPPYMHALFGALYGALVGAQGAPAAVTLAIEGAVMVGAVAMFLVGRKRMGFFVNGYRKGKTRRVVAALIGAFLVAMGLAAWSKEVLGLHWPALALGAVMFGVGTWASVAWQRVYRRELNAAPGPAA